MKSINGVMGSRVRGIFNDACGELAVRATNSLEVFEEACVVVFEPIGVPIRGFLYEAWVL